MKLILNNGRNNHGRRLVELIETSEPLAKLFKPIDLSLA